MGRKNRIKPKTVQEHISRYSVKHPSGCINWSGHINSCGYGTTNFNGKFYMAHRLSWIEERGEIKDGFVIDHLCLNKSCINVEHLELVTRGENTRRYYWDEHGYNHNLLHKSI